MQKQVWRSDYGYTQTLANLGNWENNQDFLREGKYRTPWDINMDIKEFKRIKEEETEHEQREVFNSVKSRSGIQGKNGIRKKNYHLLLKYMKKINIKVYFKADWEMKFNNI